MRLSATDRDLIEHALDALALRIGVGGRATLGEIDLYQRAVRLVRDVPAGQRRIRSDWQTKRQTAQAQLPIESVP